MATKGERHALLFLAAVALLGAGARAFRAKHVTGDTTAIERQIEAADRSRPTRGKRKAKTVQPGDSGAARPVAAMPTIDLDRAAVSEIDKLPGIGRALAARIVADRDAHGAFGCLAALDAVKGIGPVMLNRLDSLVSFSGPPRPACASGGRDGTGPGPR